MLFHCLLVFSLVKILDAVDSFGPDFIQIATGDKAHTEVRQIMAARPEVDRRLIYPHFFLTFCVHEDAFYTNNEQFRCVDGLLVCLPRRPRDADVELSKSNFEQCGELESNSAFFVSIKYEHNYIGTNDLWFSVNAPTFGLDTIKKDSKKREPLSIPLNTITKTGQHYCVKLEVSESLTSNVTTSINYPLAEFDNREGFGVVVPANDVSYELKFNVYSNGAPKCGIKLFFESEDRIKCKESHNSILKCPKGQYEVRMAETKRFSLFKETLAGEVLYREPTAYIKNALKSHMHLIHIEPAKSQAQEAFGLPSSPKKFVVICEPDEQIEISHQTIECTVGKTIYTYETGIYSSFVNGVIEDSIFVQ